MQVALIFALAAVLNDPAPQGNQQPTALVRVSLEGAPQAGLLELTSEFDVVYRDPGAGTADVLVRPTERARLAAIGLPFEVLHEDLSAFYAERLEKNPGRSGQAPAFGAWLTPPFGQGSMGGYYTWSEMAAVLDQIAAAYPLVVTPKFSLGLTHEGRELWAVKISDNPGIDENEPETRIDAVHHAREPGGMHTALWELLYLAESYGSDPLATWIVDHREVWFIPCVNADGYEYNRQTNPNGGGLWRKNRRNNGSNFGVDLNRNYPVGWGWDNIGSSPSAGSSTYRGPAAGSEPATQAMTAFMAARNFSTALTLHTYSNLWLSNWGYIGAAPADAPAIDEIGQLATYINGYPAGSCFSLLYPINGGTQDTDYGMYGTFSWLPEIGSSGDGFWPPTSRIVPLAEENRLGIARTILAAGAWVRVESYTLTDLGDGDGNLEPGESFEVRFHVRNSGRMATTGSVEFTLQTSSSGVTLINASVDLGSLAAFTSTNNDANPLVFQINSNASLGDIADIAATARWEGFADNERIIRPIGEPRIFLSDTLEIDLGWTAGLPGDNATSGLWEYGAPLGTTSAGRLANPSVDATPEGTRCFTTGNGATGASGDDVDDGKTTLLSPRMDLSAAKSAVISYERWFANFSNADDSLDVSVSNDDGSNWVPVESLTQTANAWTTSSFVLNAFVPPSDAVRLRFVTSDEPDNSILEAAVDDVRVEIFETGPFLHLYGRPAVGAPISSYVTGEAGALWLLFWSPGTANLTIPALAGTLLIDPTGAQQAAAGLIPAVGTARKTLVSPNDPTLVGQTVYLQGVVAMTGGLTLTNRDSLTFE